MTTATALTELLNRHRPLDAPEIAPMRDITPDALGWRLGRQVYEGLAGCGMHEQRLLTCDLAQPTSADVAYLTALRAKIQARFDATLADRQVHIRAVEKFQKQLVQPIAALAKAQAKFDTIEAAVKKAGNSVEPKLQGQLGAANGELKKARARVEDLQAQIDAEFVAARTKLETFLIAKRAQEYALSLPSVVGTTPVTDLLWLQLNIRRTHMWDPAAPAFNTIVNRYL